MQEVKQIHNNQTQATDELKQLKSSNLKQKSTIETTEQDLQKIEEQKVQQE